jgi:hypothetical protein
MMNRIAFYDAVLLTISVVVIMIIIVIQATRSQPDRSATIKGYLKRLFLWPNVMSLVIGGAVAMAVVLYYVGIPVGRLPQNPFSNL